MRLEVSGLTEAKLRFTRVAERTSDVEPAAALIVEVLRNAARDTFLMMGERGAPPAWEPDSYEWMVRKIREGYDPRTEFRTHNLFKSLTTAGRVRVSRSSVTFGSGVRYAKYQTRQLIKLTAEDRNEVRQIWFDYITAR
jgi:hypothetical protein